MYVPQDYQKSFHNSPARFKNIIGGSRSGKSYPAAREFYKRLCVDLRRAQLSGNAEDFMHYWVVTPDFPLGKVAMRELFATIRQHNWRHVKKWRQSYKELWLYPNILIEFKSANDPNKLVAVKLHGGWIDEIARLKAEAWLGGIRQRFADLSGWCIFSTSPIGKNWYYDEIIRRGIPGDVLYDDEFANFWFKTSQNKYIPAKEIEAARRQLPPKYFRREYEASLEEFFGQVFEEYSREVHRYPRPGVVKPTSFKSIIAGQDWGFSTPGVLSVFGKSFDKSPRYYELETVYEDKMLVVDPARNNEIIHTEDNCQTWLEHALRIKRKYGELYPSCDSVKFYTGKDRPENIEIYKNAGLNMMETDYSVQAGIQTVSTLLHVNELTGVPRLFFRADTIKATDSEYQSYQWAKYSDGVTKDEPVKKNDHRIDGDRYCLHGEESKSAPAMAIVEPDDGDGDKVDWYDEDSYSGLRRRFV